MTTTTAPVHHHHVGVRRSAAAVAASLTVLFVLCWLGTLVDIPVSHAWIGLFTPAPTNSLQALAEGVGWSIVLGAFVGGVAAFFYNSFAALQRR